MSQQIATEVGQTADTAVSLQLYFPRESLGSGVETESRGVHATPPRMRGGPSLCSGPGTRARESRAPSHCTDGPPEPSQMQALTSNEPTEAELLNPQNRGGLEPRRPSQRLRSQCALISVSAPGKAG